MVSDRRPSAEVRRSEVLTPSLSPPPTTTRLGMLGEEAVPRADSVLAALAKHLEVKLAFGATAMPDQSQEQSPRRAPG